jgi:hypothetical protein
MDITAEITEPAVFSELMQGSHLVDRMSDYPRYCVIMGVCHTPYLQELQSDQWHILFIMDLQAIGHHHFDSGEIKCPVPCSRIYITTTDKVTWCASFSLTNKNKIYKIVLLVAKKSFRIFRIAVCWGQRFFIFQIITLIDLIKNLLNLILGNIPKY